MITSRRVTRSSALTFAVAALGLSSQVLYAVDIPLDSDSLEVQRKTTGEYFSGQAQPTTGMRLGYQSSYGSGSGASGGIEALMYFALPALPAGQKVSTASLKFSELPGANTLPTFNVDLYGLGFDKNNPPLNDDVADTFGTTGHASPIVSTAYFYSGPSQTTDITPPSNVVALPINKIQDNILQPADWTNSVGGDGTGLALHTTDTTGSANLAAFIQAAYDAGAVAGNYLILRLNPDLTGISSGTQRYQIPFEQTVSSTNYPNATVPTLSLSFAASRITGDTNGDGVVDLTDLNNVLNNFGVNGAGNPGDDNGDNTVDLTDLNDVLNNFGTHSPAASGLSVVPEPASLSLLAIGAAGLLSRRRRA